MNRTGLLIALAVAVVVGVVFGLHPELDLRIAAPFYQIAIGGNKFGLRIDPSLMLARDMILWLATALTVAVVFALVVKLVLPRRRLLISARAIVFLLSTLALAPGLVANLTLKDHWSRPRPIDVAQFGGPEHFVPWWDPRGDCASNCSFVSGDVSAAFWLLAPAALTPPPWRALAYAGALALGGAMAALRVAAGGHFFSDVAFAGVFTFLIIWLAHALIYRWPRTRLNESRLERALARFAMPGHNFAMRLFNRKRRSGKTRTRSRRSSFRGARKGRARTP
jgi:membrane-associated PAP2 superfamily phosphatase